MRRKLVGFVFVIAFVLAVSKILLTARLATRGTELLQVANQTQGLTEQNLLLKEEILERSSLSRLSSAAAQLGFLPAGKIVSLTREVPIAFHESREIR